jgi:hypothetical protein
VGIILFVLVFLGITIASIANRPFTIVQVDQPQHNAFVCIFGDNSVGQTFISRARDLEAVEIFFGPIPSENVTVIFRLQMGGRDIRTVAVNASDLVYHEYNRFSFPRVTDSEDKQFGFVLDAPNATSIDPVCISYIELTEVNPEVYADGSAFVNGKQIPADLNFRVLSEITLNEVFTNLYSRASKDVPFFAAYLFVLVALGVTLAKVKRSGSRQRLLKQRTRRGNGRE